LLEQAVARVAAIVQIILAGLVRRAVPQVAETVKIAILDQQIPAAAAAGIILKVAAEQAVRE
jgi:hypothetical protein